MLPEESHQHSLLTLNIINKYDDFMSGIKNVCDMGAGSGLDAVWWATLKNEDGRDRKIKVTAVEISPNPRLLKTAGDMQWKFQDYNEVELPPQDLIWCHDAFQYSLNPIGTLCKWNKLLRKDGLLMIEVPYLLGIHNHRDHLNPDVTIKTGTYHIFTLSNLIMQLAASGFDCRGGHFQLDRVNGWIRAAVYKEDEPKFYNNWYELAESGKLPLCLDDKIHAANQFNDSDLVVEWIDRSISILSL